MATSSVAPSQQRQPAAAPPPPPKPGTNPNARFGTFAGVFVPNILTILGLILFLRTGWVVGQAGLLGALAIVLLANAISFLTGLSLASIATNMRVRAGGNYYIISRSLGLEVGGAIGIPLYMSQAISVAFYVIGFTAALQTIEPFAGIEGSIISTVVVLLFIGIAYIGADFALRIQFFILAVLTASIISFFTGSWGNFIEPTLTASYTEDVTFWIVFATFFPAVTGIEVGVSLSGDLKEPSKSIPRGTIASILFTAAIYIASVVWFSVNSTPEQLIGEELAMESIASVPFLILAGVWASTLSSALGSVLSAPRTLQAIARDGVVSTRLAGQMGSKTEPRVAVLVTAVVALSIVALGDIDVVAPVISMFFLNTYGMVNLTAAIEKVVGNPSFRPRFEVPWQVSMLGAIGCYGAMVLINPLATVVAIVVSYGFFLLLEQRQIRRAFGDVRTGLWFALSRYALLRLEHQRWHAKNWRPNLMVFTGQPHNRERLVEVADWLSMGRGVVTFFQFIVDSDGKHTRAMSNRADVARDHIRKYIEDHGMKAFAECEVVEDFQSGALAVAQAHGIGGLQVNTVLMGWSRTGPGRARQVALMRDLIALHKSVVFMHYDHEHGFGNKRLMHIWWAGKGGNADLMLLFTHLIEEHPAWRRAKVKLIRVIDSKEGIPNSERHLNALLDEARVEAEPLVVVRDYAGQPLHELISEHNLRADLTLMGMGVPQESYEAVYAERLHQLVSCAGSVLLVHNAQQDEELLITDE
jgi:amino acid transporter